MLTSSSPHSKHNPGLRQRRQPDSSRQCRGTRRIVSGADHFYIQSPHDGVPGGVETPAIIAWLRYWIYNDQGAKSYFYGDDCVMCKSPWTAPHAQELAVAAVTTG